ncbi:MAG: Zn-ribbon domain-containing OB-fold protein [Myxococcota bacterium]
MSSRDQARGPQPPIEPIPDRDSAPYWEALRQGELRLQRCEECAALRWPARAICNRCRSFDCEWEAVSPHGRILSWTRTEQVFAPSLRESVPYYTVQVALDAQSDILMIGGWLSSRTPRAGELVEMEPVRPDPKSATRLPFWKPIAED